MKYTVEFRGKNNPSFPTTLKVSKKALAKYLLTHNINTFQSITIYGKD